MKAGQCGARFGLCECVRLAEHRSHHRCRCKQSWTDEGEIVVYAGGIKVDDPAGIELTALLKRQVRMKPVSARRKEATDV